MNLPNPRVTVAIPVFNGEQHIAKAIESVLEQDFRSFELIITDNASTDRTSSVCNSYAQSDDRIIYHRNSRNLGAAANYNLGLSLARGRYFKWLAHDDWISVSYLSACAEVLDEYDDVGLAHGIPREMLDEATPYLDSTFTVPLWGPASPLSRFSRAMRMDRTCHAIFGLYRREILERTTGHMPYYTSDRNLVAETALLSRFVAVPEAVFYNRKHAKQSMAMSSDRRALQVWQDTSNQSQYSTEHLCRLSHFWHLAGRHPQIASRSRILLATASYLFSPSMLCRYLDEALGALLPRFYGRIRDVAKAAYRQAKPSPCYITEGAQSPMQAPQTKAVSPKPSSSPEIFLAVPEQSRSWAPAPNVCELAHDGGPHAPQS